PSAIAKPNAKRSAGNKPKGSAETNTTVVAARVAPKLNDMMLPDSVMKVMPTATQPTNDTVVASERRLVAEKKPGVSAAATTSATQSRTRTMCSNVMPRPDA